MNDATARQTLAASGCRFGHGPTHPGAYLTCLGWFYRPPAPGPAQWVYLGNDATSAARTLRGILRPEVVR